MRLPVNIKKFIEELKDRGNRLHIRKEAAEALGNIGDSRAVKPLIDALKDEDYHVRKEASKTLLKITNDLEVIDMANKVIDEGWV